jgi:hypothetical protein
MGAFLLKLFGQPLVFSHFDSPSSSPFPTVIRHLNDEQAGKGVTKLIPFKEWAYAGFAINLGSALIAHSEVGDGPEAWGWAAATGVLWGLSYFFWRRLQVTQASA